MTAVLLSADTSVRETPPATLDQTLARRTRQAIRSAGHLCLRNVVVEVSDGNVHLGGQVHTVFLRELARDAAQGVTGVRGVECDIDVL